MELMMNHRKGRKKNVNRKDAGKINLGEMLKNKRGWADKRKQRK